MDGDPVGDGLAVDTSEMAHQSLLMGAWPHVFTVVEFNVNHGASLSRWVNGRGRFSLGGGVVVDDVVVVVDA